MDFAHTNRSIMQATLHTICSGKVFFFHKCSETTDTYRLQHIFNIHQCLSKLVAWSKINLDASDLNSLYEFVCKFSSDKLDWSVTTAKLIFDEIYIYLWATHRTWHIDYIFTIIYLLLCLQLIQTAESEPLKGVAAACWLNTRESATKWWGQIHRQKSMQSR